MIVLTQTETAPSGTGATSAVVLEAVSVDLDGHRILSDVSLVVGAGDVVGLSGPSGSGKSTLLHTIGGLIPPAAGSVTLGGERLDALTPTERAALRLRQVGFVFQFGHLLPELSALDNVAVVLRLQGQSRAAARDQARTLLDGLGLGALAERRPGQLSGGELQRVAVARALIARPAVVLADEPTGALDSANGNVVLDLLLSAVAAQRCALIIASHDESVIGATGRVVRMRDGRLEERQ